jgi:hypothetical protein
MQLRYDLVDPLHRSLEYCAARNWTRDDHQARGAKDMREGLRLGTG